MRYFIAISPSPEIILKINSWFSFNWPAVRKPVAPRNYHLTLAFLGELRNSQLSTLCDLLSHIEFSSFALDLDDTGYWPHNGLLWLGPSTTPVSLTELAKNCRLAGNRVQISSEKKAYKPHLTLARRLTVPPLQPLQTAVFNLKIEQFELYESINGKSGVRYREVQRWNAR